MALTLRQSQPLHDVAELDAEIEKAQHKLDDDPTIVPAASDRRTAFCENPRHAQFNRRSSPCTCSPAL